MEEEELDEYTLGDEEIVLRLKRLVRMEDSFPKNFFLDVDVFYKDPSMEFDAEVPGFVFIKSRAEGCGDGCDSGCWRIIGRDKLIITEDGLNKNLNGKQENQRKEILGFKKIYKFCEKRNPRYYKRSWVMEEYRLNKNLNWKQDHVICKIRLLFRAEISSLLAQHFRSTPVSLLSYEILPKYGDDEDHLMTIKCSAAAKKWPDKVTNDDVYRLDPLMLANPLDQKFLNGGICIFSNKTLRTDDKCCGGCWRILHGENLIKSQAGEVLGFKKVFKFYATKPQTYIWVIEEYRVNNEVWQNKRLCVISVRKRNTAQGSPVLDRIRENDHADLAQAGETSAGAGEADRS